MFLDIFATVVFIWLFFKVIKLAFRVTWGAAKIIASILLGIAFPLLVVCLIFVGGVVLLVPIAMIGIAFGLLKRCA